MNVSSISPALTSPNPGETQERSAGLQPGERLSAIVTEAAGGRVTLSFPGGETLTASQQTMDTLRVGDQVLLEVRPGGEGGGPKLALLSVNGQPLSPEASEAEYALLRMAVPPSRANLATNSALARIGAVPTPEIFARIGELAARFSSMPPREALLFAASSLPIAPDTVEAFARWLQNPAQGSAFAAATEFAANDPAAAARILAALPALTQQAAPVPGRGEGNAPPAAGQATSARGEAPPIPAGLSHSLTSLLERSGVWADLCRDLPTLPRNEARGRIMQLMADLPAETPGVERTLLYRGALALCLPESREGSMAPTTGQPAVPPQAGDNPPDSAAKALPDANFLPLPGGAAEEGGPLPDLKTAIRGLFAALSTLPIEEQGPALSKAAENLPTKAGAFARALAAQAGEQPAALRPVLELATALPIQAQMGAELGNLYCAQLPFLFRETRQEAALYMLKRNGGGTKVDESNTTVALCLETENLGPVDALIRVERDELSLQFWVESPNVKAVFESSLSAAAKLPFPPQYRFKGAAVQLRAVPITPLNAGEVLQKAFGLGPRRGLNVTV